MRIKTVKLTDYKAFLGTHTIKVGGKNLFIYGENGSGKSSLYYALKDFFQGSMENINIQMLENIFVEGFGEDDHSCGTQIAVTFSPNKNGEAVDTDYVFSTAANDTRASEDTSIRDGNKLKSFLTYRHLLGIHNLKQDDSINLFDLLVHGVLRHYSSPLTEGKELFELYEEIQEILAKQRTPQYRISKKKDEANRAIATFNKAFGQLFRDGVDNIHTNARPILEKFGHNVDFELKFTQVRPNGDYTAITGDVVSVDLTYADRVVSKPHMFLNEARLSAIAISIYLGMIKRHLQNIPCKILFLDDVFIGLDVSNRMPLLKILDEDFAEYQVFITTYDKPWFELARAHLNPNGKWRTLEFYAGYNDEGYSTPIVFDQQDLLAKANQHLTNCDYKSAAVYTRSAYEKIIRKACEDQGKKIVFKQKLKAYSSNVFWEAIKLELDPTLVTELEVHRASILNPLSHFNSELQEIRSELESAIKTVSDLRTAINGL